MIDKLCANMSSASTIFRSLIGTWHLTRFTSRGTARGTAQFSMYSPAPPTLFYREEGDLPLFNGQTNTFHQEYWYQFFNEKIFVYQNENDLKADKKMHILEFTDTKPIVGTPFHCAPDVYNPTYDFTRLNEEFRLSYSVKGPRKDYTILTIFQRSLPGR